MWKLSTCTSRGVSAVVAVLGGRPGRAYILPGGTSGSKGRNRLPSENLDHSHKAVILLVTSACVMVPQIRTTIKGICWLSMSESSSRSTVHDSFCTPSSLCMPRKCGTHMSLKISAERPNIPNDATPNDPNTPCAINSGLKSYSLFN